MSYKTRLNSKSTPWLPLGISCTKPVVVTAGYNISGIEQVVARKAHNLEVVGSTPTPATNMTKCHIET